MMTENPGTSKICRWPPRSICTWPIGNRKRHRIVAGMRRDTAVRLIERDGTTRKRNAEEIAAECRRTVRAVRKAQLEFGATCANMTACSSLVPVMSTHVGLNPGAVTKSGVRTASGGIGYTPFAISRVSLLLLPTAIVA